MHLKFISLQRISSERIILPVLLRIKRPQTFQWDLKDEGKSKHCNLTLSTRLTHSNLNIKILSFSSFFSLSFSFRNHARTTYAFWFNRHPRNYWCVVQIHFVQCVICIILIQVMYLKRRNPDKPCAHMTRNTIQQLYLLVSAKFLFSIKKKEEKSISSFVLSAFNRKVSKDHIHIT